MKKKLYQLLEKATKNKKLNLNKDYKIDKLKGWDSLSNINFLLSIEESFKIRFSINELSSLIDTKSILNALNKKKKK
tara:strand:+ start:165 stop:395 length:231 start_codon:yes stop_codon:yes gene_type:complete